MASLLSTTARLVVVPSDAQRSRLRDDGEQHRTRCRRTRGRGPVQGGGPLLRVELGTNYEEESEIAASESSCREEDREASKYIPRGQREEVWCRTELRVR